MRKLKALITVLLIMSMCLAMAACSTKKYVELDPYIRVEFSGKNGEGVATISFDEDTYNEDYAFKVTINPSNNTAGLTFLGSSDTNQLFLVHQCVDYALDRTTGLSNGDVVKVIWNNDDQKAQDWFRIGISYSELVFTVEGLE